MKEDEQSRQEILQQAKDYAIEQAVKNGAIRSTCAILDIQEINMTYVALPRKRLSIKAVGDLQEIIHDNDTIIKSVANVNESTNGDKHAIRKSGLLNNHSFIHSFIHSLIIHSLPIQFPTHSFIHSKTIHSFLFFRSLFN